MVRILHKICVLILASSLLLTLSGCSDFFTPRSGTVPGSTPRFAFVANFQGGSAGTISIFSINASTGALTTAQSPVSTGSSTATNGPAALVTVGGKFLYSANDGGTVSGFTVNTST